jgi:hypothetical protein
MVSSDMRILRHLIKSEFKLFPAYTPSREHS